MSITRHFLDWDAPLTEKLRGFLVRESVSGIVDLSGFEIIVPTRQSGRRLREHLALFCAEEGTALFAPRVVTPRSFMEPDDLTAIANPTLVHAIWTDVLSRVDLARLPGLFPAGAPSQDINWAMNMADLMQELRNTLVEGGYSIETVLSSFGMEVPEPDRWENLAYLEEAYLHALDKRGLQDPCKAVLKRAKRFALQPDTKDVVVAAVSDCPRLLEKILDQVAADVRVSILVHAPEALANTFDEWGRPLPEKWCDKIIPVDEAERNIVLAGSPLAQSREVLSVMAEESGKRGPLDIAIGVPDPSIVPYLKAELEAHDLVAYDPSGVALREHRLLHLLSMFQGLLEEYTYRSLADLLRHPDVLLVLQEKHALAAGSVLSELDQFQNKFLPVSVSDVNHRLERVDDDGPFVNLAKAVRWVGAQTVVLKSAALPSALKTLLQEIYDVQQVNATTSEGEEFVQVAAHIMTALEELDDEHVQALNLRKDALFDLVLKRLGDQKFYADRSNTMVDLEGWLELPWNDAPLLVVTGMNDGFVPDGSVGDIFLPDSFLKKLGLHHDQARHARDAHIMSSLVTSRHDDGRVCFISGKVSGSGDPLKPSRLLFHAEDDETIARAHQLFRDPDEKKESHAMSISFKLAPGDELELQEAKELSVTAFKDYLACPFRFFLAHMLAMESLDDKKTEMDALDFGTMIHAALGNMATSEWKDSSDEDSLRTFLWQQVDSWVLRRFGKSHPLQVTIQLEAAKQRLASAARIQASLVDEGWEIVASESSAGIVIHGVDIRGRIDRIDRHRDSGVLRILDYKTSDAASSPEKMHWGMPLNDSESYSLTAIGSKSRRWCDLQLPMYHHMLSPKLERAAGVELGYFNLPKAVSDSGIQIWKGFEEVHLRSALACAEGVVADILERRFWPPRRAGRYDSFESLHGRDLLSVLDEAAFQTFFTAGKQAGSNAAEVRV